MRLSEVFSVKSNPYMDCELAYYTKPASYYINRLKRYTKIFSGN